MATRTRHLVAAYLVTIAAANLIAAALLPTVPWITLVIGFALIGLDLSLRDVLHDRWGQRWGRNMVALILAGAALSAALNWQALPVAVASCVAFGVSAAADALLYDHLRGRRWLLRVNASNALGALLDSAAFLLVLSALDALPLGVALGLIAPQWLVKVGGGAVWSMLIQVRRHAPAP